MEKYARKAKYRFDKNQKMDGSSRRAKKQEIKNANRSLKKSVRQELKRELDRVLIKLGY